MPLLFITVVLVLFLVGSILALFLALNSLMTMFRDKVPYVSTPDWAVRWMGEHVRLPDGATLVDLGCGDGRVLVGLKQYFPRATMIGYDRQWWPWLLAQWKTRGTGIKIRRQNFYAADLSKVDVVYCFLIHAVMPRVETLLKTKLRPGAMVYSYGFTFPSWEPVERIVNPEKPQGSKINIYRV